MNNNELSEVAINENGQLVERANTGEYFRIYGIDRTSKREGCRFVPHIFYSRKGFGLNFLPFKF